MKSYLNLLAGVWDILLIGSQTTLLNGCLLQGHDVYVR